MNLKVNEEKSAVDRPWKRKFLGFSFMMQKEARIRVSPKSLKKVKDKVSQLTNPIMEHHNGRLDSQTEPMPDGMNGILSLDRDT